MSKNLYTPKAPVLFLIIVSLLLVMVLEAIYIHNTKTMTKEMQGKKKDFVAFVGLPDLAISTEATFVRHRTMSEVFSIYKDDGSLREYFPSTFAFSHSHIINGTKNAK